MFVIRLNWRLLECELNGVSLDEHLFWMARCFPRELSIYQSPAQSYTNIQTEKEKAAEIYSFPLFSVSDGLPRGWGELVDCMIKCNWEVPFECNSSVFFQQGLVFTAKWSVFFFFLSKLFNGQAWTWNWQSRMRKIMWDLGFELEIDPTQLVLHQWLSYLNGYRCVKSDVWI